MKRMFSILLCLCMLLGVLSACSRFTQEPDASTPPMDVSDTSDKVEARFASSYDEVYQALETSRENAGRGLYFGADAPVPQASSAETAGEAASDAAEANGEGSVYYSGTNVQVEGVDEGDIVKTDGSYLYVVRDYEMIILQVNGAEVTEVSHIMVGNAVYNEEQENGEIYTLDKYPQAMYLCGDRAVVISTLSEYTDLPDGSSQSKNYTAVDIYDISDRTAPTAVATLGQDGYSIDSRMIGDTLYLITSYYPNSPDAAQPNTFAPCTYRDGEATPVECGNIAMLPEDDSMTFSVLGTYSIPDAGMTGTQSILGGGDTVYMNAEHLYLCRMSYDDTVTDTKNDGQYEITSHTQTVNTVVTRYDVADSKLSYSASATVPGGLLNQFSLDEKDGFLRVVTTEDRSDFRVFVDAENEFTNYKNDGTTRSNDLFVLDGDLEQIGSVTGIAEDEQVYSVRFQGDYGYFCTYRTTDPIFAVDLTDPAAPKVVGEVKLSGYSDYLHAWSDDLLFGLGMETQEITDENGTTAMLDGMKMVMIDKSDPADLKEAGVTSINADYSEALTNHKAILVDPERNLIAFPAEGSYLVYGYTPEEGFALRAEVAVSEWDWNNRGVVIGDYFYVCGSDCVDILDLNSLENVGQTILSRG